MLNIDDIIENDCRVICSGQNMIFIVKFRDSIFHFGEQFKAIFSSTSEIDLSAPIQTYIMQMLVFNFVYKPAIDYVVYTPCVPVAKRLPMPHHRRKKNRIKITPNTKSEPFYSAVIFVKWMHIIYIPSLV